MKTNQNNSQAIAYQQPESEELSVRTEVLCTSDTTIPGGIDPWVPSGDPFVV